MYNLTETQKNTLRWLVAQAQSGVIPEEFGLVKVQQQRGRLLIPPLADIPYDLTDIVLTALEDNKLLILNKKHNTTWWGSLTGKAYEAVANDFAVNAAVSSTINTYVAGDQINTGDITNSQVALGRDSSLETNNTEAKPDEQ